MKQWKSYFTFVRPYMKWIVFTLFIGMIKFSIPLTLPMILKYVVDDLLMNPAMSAQERVSQLMLILGGALFYS